MDNFPKIEFIINKLRQHETNAPGTDSMRYMIVGARLMAEAIQLYLQGDDSALSKLEVPQLLDKVPPTIRPVINSLKAMREAGANPYLTFRLVSDTVPGWAWFPAEYDGEHKLWGYVSNPIEPGLRIFYIQELPADIRLCTAYKAEHLNDLIASILGLLKK